MKTNEVNSAAVVSPAGPAPERTSQDAAPPSLPTDRATLAQSSSFRATVSANMSVSASERPSRLHDLAQQVRAGVYRPNSSELADQILAEAEFDAHLKNTLG